MVVTITDPISMPAQDEAVAPPAIQTGEVWRMRWKSLPRTTRREHMENAARQWFAWWREGVDFEAIPASTWGWCDATPCGAALVAPTGLLRQRPSPLALPDLIDCMADWLFGHAPDLNEEDRHRFIEAFALAGGLDLGARRSLRRRIHRSAVRRSAERARSAVREARQELNHQCRQSVSCRGVWLPDPLLSVEEIRAMIDGTFRARPARSHAAPEPEEMPALLNREEVLIRRYRNAGTAAQGPGRILGGSLSPARRDWIACVALRRLGISVPQPIGLLEILQNGSVTDGYVIARVPHRSEPARPRTARGLCDAWLRLLDRGITHLDPILPDQPGGLDEDAVYAACWHNLAGLRLGRMAWPLDGFFALRNLQRSAGHLVSLRDRRTFLVVLAERWPWLRHAWIRRLLGAPSSP